MKTDNNLLKELDNSATNTIKVLEDDESYQENNIIEMFDYAFRKCKNNDKINDLIMFAYINNHLKKLINNKKLGHIIINSNFPLVELKNLVNKNSEAYKQIMLKIEKNKEEFIIQTINYSINKYLRNIKINESMLKLIQEIIFIILKEIALNENEDINNLELIGRGDFSFVYAIKDKVIKIGSNRATPKFPNNPYIVKPLLRKAIPISDNNDIVFIEVCEKIKTNCCTDEDVYNLYKSLREIGLIWMDPKKSNIGKLIKDNKIYWHNNLKPTDSSLMLDKYIEGTELKAGDPIICDSDSIYIYSKKINIQRVGRLECRYRGEKYF
ncbi:MAG: hypothetical protein HFI86_09005 [Bacilli bacterium]|nr:hypothetical protein [Bacilli bacterium]